MAIIYVDLVFLLNFIVDYLLLNMTGRMIKKEVSTLMLLSGAVIGGFYSILNLLAFDSFFFSGIFKLLFSGALILFTFGIMQFKGFIRALLMFYFVNFAFCGGIYALLSLLNGISQALTFGVFALYSVIAYIFLFIFDRLRQGTIVKNKVKIVISANNKENEINCILDTGNSLYTPFSQKPVVVVEEDKIHGLLNGTFPGESNLKPIAIPYNSIGCRGGIIYGFTPEYAYILSNGKRQKLTNFVVGVYKGELSIDGSYNGLISPSLIA
ncbi:MAG: sigma-E processing peptidase SpoIIGA [Eubacteriales bacterium]|nr:sigma-E processing peptidase SpoIIGA [Eubacteriales bacterium]